MERCGNDYGFVSRTFADEFSCDWNQLDLFTANGVEMSPQNSQSSDYLRDAELTGLDPEEVDEFFKNCPDLSDAIKIEPECPTMDDFGDLMVMGPSEGAQQLSPGICTGGGVWNDPVVVVDNITGPIVQIEDVVITGTEMDEIPLSVSSVVTYDEDEGISSVSSSRGTSVKRSSRHSRHLGPAHSGSWFSDEYLVNIPTKEFNRKIHALGLSPDETRKLKQKRRTLKNRGYAQNCRQKRVGSYKEMRDEITALKQQVRQLCAEKELLVRESRQQKNENSRLKAALAARDLVGM